MDSRELDVRLTCLEARHEQTRTVLDGHLNGTDDHLSRQALRQHRSRELLRQTIEDTSAALALAATTITRVADDLSRRLAMIEAASRARDGA